MRETQRYLMRSQRQVVESVLWLVNRRIVNKGAAHHYSVTKNKNQAHGLKLRSQTQTSIACFLSHVKS